jgi:adenylate kinase
MSCTLTNSAANQQPAPADSNFLPGPVLLLGAPGVGKGTQAQLLVSAFGIPQISTGDILRTNIAQGTSLGKAAKSLMGQGQLVPDDLVNQMVADRLTQPDTIRGYILDGFPRTLNQAEWVDTHLNATGTALPIVAISILVDYDVLLHRITGRRICPTCKTIYNVFSNPPKTAEVCDNEGAALTQRPDDIEAVFTERMKTFTAQTAPVVEHYRNRGRFQEVNGNQSVESVSAAIQQALKTLRNQ